MKHSNDNRRIMRDGRKKAETKKKENVSTCRK